MDDEAVTAPLMLIVEAAVTVLLKMAGPLNVVSDAVMVIAFDPTVIVTPDVFTTMVTDP